MAVRQRGVGRCGILLHVDGGSPDETPTFLTRGRARLGLQVCDFNGDGKVTASDALSILHKAIGLDVQGSCAALRFD
ncbi:MAG TPA: hypothetical protein VEL28_19225 [Candidatus Binatia bacterium]|nr:hypothetical protein [Candidatus Binatia bacterium]